jgi:hypothetical protein
MLEGFSPDAVSEVRRRLDMVRRSGVRILFAVESGSRAWGFPSPDSDYDCRFVYVRSIEDHLKLSPERDVIEFPIEGEIDTGGWDLRKALLLALKGNAVIGEWVHSPHIYEEAHGFRERLAKLLDTIVDPKMVARHYFGLLKRHDQTFSGEKIKLKKLFYALRPAFSLQYMEERGFATLPPMNLQQLVGNIRLPTELSELVADMVEEKAVTREMGVGTPPDEIMRFLTEAHQRYSKLVETLGSTDHDVHREHYAVAERFYVDEVSAKDGLSAV